MEVSLGSISLEVSLGSICNLTANCLRFLFYKAQTNKDETGLNLELKGDYKGALESHNFRL